MVRIRVGHRHGGADANHAAGERAQEVDTFACRVATVAAFDDRIGRLRRCSGPVWPTFDTKHHAFTAHLNNQAGFLEPSESVKEDCVEVSGAIDDVGGFEFIQCGKDRRG